MVTMIRLVVEIQLKVVRGKNEMYEFLEIEIFERYLLRSIV